MQCLTVLLKLSISISVHGKYYKINNNNKSVIDTKAINNKLQYKYCSTNKKLR